jgi:hypothetical protein
MYADEMRGKVKSSQVKSSQAKSSQHVRGRDEGQRRAVLPSEGVGEPGADVDVQPADEACEQRDGDERPRRRIEDGEGEEGHA